MQQPITVHPEARPITVALVGAGHRTVEYARYALDHPDRMQAVAIAEPDDLRRRKLADAHAIPHDRRFASYQDLVARDRIANAAINGTMDGLHHASTMALIESGYHVLLEKPIAQQQRHVRELIKASEQHGVTVMICHVLRYAPFYQTIRDLIDKGAIGPIVAMTTNENVSYHHMAAGFIRGRWRRREANPMLLAKCCHDLDLIAWFNSGVRAERVASFGCLTQFKPENAPPGSTPRCLDGCVIETTCPYSARINYIEQDLWGTYAWESIEHIDRPTVQDKLTSLRTDNPFGRCVWHCDNDVVDHQTVIVAFANGVTATHNMFCATARPTRTMHIVGERGEIEGDLEAGRIEVRTPDTAIVGSESAYHVEVIDVNASGAGEQDGHGGGDGRLVADFAAIIAGEPPSRSVTHIQDSLTGHLIAFAADMAMLERRVVELER